MFVNAVEGDPRRAIEIQYFHRLKESKRFRAACYVFRDRRGSVRDQMNENAKREMLDAVAMPAQGCVDLAGTAAGIRRKIMLPEISCFRKVTQ